MRLDLPPIKERCQASDVPALVEEVEMLRAKLAYTMGELAGVYYRFDQQADFERVVTWADEEMA